MPQVTITVTDTYDVPEGTTIVLARTGVVSGLRLPDGQFLKPFMTMEHYADEGGDPIDENIGEVELNALDVFSHVTGGREVEVVEGELETDDSATQR